MATGGTQTDFKCPVRKRIPFKNSIANLTMNSGKTRRVYFCQTFLRRLDDKNMYWFSTSATILADWIIFSRDRTIMRIQFFNSSDNFSSSCIFFSNASACVFGPRCEPGMISSPFVVVLISGRFFGKMLKLSIAVFQWSFLKPNVMGNVIAHLAQCLLV